MQQLKISLNRVKEHFFIFLRGEVRSKWKKVLVSYIAPAFTFLCNKKISHYQLLIELRNNSYKKKKKKLHPKGINSVRASAINFPPSKGAAPEPVTNRSWVEKRAPINQKQA